MTGKRMNSKPVTNQQENVKREQIYPKKNPNKVRKYNWFNSDEHKWKP